MANTLSTVIPLGSKSKLNNTGIYPRLHAVYNDYNSAGKRDTTNTGVWRGLLQLVRNKYNSFRRYRRHYNFLSNRPNRTFHSGNSIQISRRSGANRFNNRYRHYLYYYIAFCLLSIAPITVRAEDEVNNTSNPVAAATGNVTNQAVQFQNNGAPSRQQYATGVSCNGSTMTFSPFYMGNETQPMNSDGYVINENWGFQINFMVPLNKNMLRRCESIAERHEEKLRLDYELVRALKCAELQQKGFTLRPKSRVAHMCHDVIPISSLTKKDVKPNQTNPFNFFKK